MKLRPGSVVLNQDLDNSMSGKVIYHVSGVVRVRWCNDEVSDEIPGDIILTADVEFDSGSTTRTDVQDAISLVNELRSDLVRTTEKIDTVLTELGRAETQLYVAAQPGGPRTARLLSGEFTINEEL